MCAASQHWLAMPKYLEQLERIRRMLNRIKRRDRSPEEYGDDVWSFFQNSWHLKDWMKNDPSVPSRVRTSIERFAAASPPLRICADLAIATKHLELRKPRAGAKHSHWNIAITPGEPSKVHYVIDTGSGTKQDGLDLARKCLSEWERILIAQGLAI
jgi:hypothetical protein